MEKENIFFRGEVNQEGKGGKYLEKANIFCRGEGKYMEKEKLLPPIVQTEEEMF